MPYLFPTPAMTAGLPARPAVAVHAEAGRFAYDTMTLVGPGTWEAARAAVDCALAAADLVRRRRARSPTRCAGRPGTTRPRPASAGSCYLNNAAVAAQALRDAGHERVGVVDVDAHHGNGTAAIFYERGDVLYGSVHVDPAAGWFPHSSGYADETGAAAGRGRHPQPAAARGHRRRALARRRRRPRRLGGRRGLHGPGRLARRRRRGRRPREPAQVTADGYRVGRAACSAAPGCRPSSCRRAATTCRPSAAWSRRTSRATRTGGEARPRPGCGLPGLDSGVRGGVILDTAPLVCPFPQERTGLAIHHHR